MIPVEIELVEYDLDGRALVDDQLYTGEVVEHDAESRLLSRTNYRDGWQDGLELHYFTDGSPEFEGCWTQGRQIGNHRYWHANGQLAQEIVYDNLGNSTRLGRWTPEGSPD